MSYSDKITKKDVLNAINSVDTNGLQGHPNSSTYDVLYNEKRYPPKAILAIASELVDGQRVDTKTFSGGYKEKSFKDLWRFGFTIVPKRLNPDQTEDSLIRYIQSYKDWDWYDDFFEILGYLINETSLLPYDPRIAFNLRLDKKRISINIGNRLVFAMLGDSLSNWFWVMLNEDGMKRAQELPEYDSSNGKEYFFEMGKPAWLIPIKDKLSKSSKDWLKDALLTAVRNNLPSVKSAGYPEKHNHFIYQAAINTDYREELKVKLNLRNMKPFKIYKISASASPNSELLFSPSRDFFYWNDKDFKMNKVGDLVVFINMTKGQAIWTELDLLGIKANYNPSSDETSFTSEGHKFVVDKKWGSFIRFKILKQEIIPREWNWTKQIGASSVYDLWKDGIQKHQDRIDKINDLKEIFRDDHELKILDGYIIELKNIMGVNKPDISGILARENFQKILNSKDFYFSKAQKLLNELRTLPKLNSLDDYMKIYIECYNSTDKFEEFIKKSYPGGLKSKILELTGKLIAHMDLQGANKAVWNEYNDNRTMARTFVRQHTFVKNIFEYLWYNYDLTQIPDYLKNLIIFTETPQHGINVTSEKHRAWIANHLLKIEYDENTFINDLKLYFDDYNLNPNNSDNLTCLISNLLYSENFVDLWRFENDQIDENEEISGLVVCDNTGWIEEAIDDLSNYEYRVLWWDKMPSGGDDTLSALREQIKRNKYFDIYYTVDQQAVYKSRIIDFATEENYNVKNWNINDDVAAYKDSFDEYNETKADGRFSKARWVFLSNKIEKLSRPFPNKNFKFFADFAEPTQNNMQPFVSVKLERKFWWVCQGDTYNEKQGKQYLWAPLKDKRGVGKEYWSNMSKVAKGDIILNYSEGLRGISIANSDGYPCDNPIVDSTWEKEGNRVDIELIEFNKILDHKDFVANKKEFEQLLIGFKGPFDINGKPKQGYLFEFNIESVKLIKDLIGMELGLDWLDKYLDEIKLSFHKKELKTQKSNIDILKHVCNFIRSRGFRYTDEDIANYYLSLKSKPFVILAGISGTGKTQLAIKFAEAIENDLKLVPVRPDWTDNSDLIGYVDLRGKFRKKTFLDSIVEADLNSDKIYFVILDEMNLARVEHYFSDFLSIIETRDESGRSKHPILSDSEIGELGDEDKGLYNLKIPNNLYIIGTVNMDETTHPFSRKVLDRANSIEMNQINLDWIDSGKEIDSISGVYNDFLKAKYVFSKDFKAKDKKDLKKTMKLLNELNDVLKGADLQFGYRVRDEVCFYMLNRRDIASIMPEDTALDFQVMQKVLPRIQGSSFRIRSIIIELLKLLNPESEKLKAIDVKNNQINSEDLESNVGELNNVKFKRSTEKLLFMFRRFEEDGFTSFWL